MKDSLKRDIGCGREERNLPGKPSADSAGHLRVTWFHRFSADGKKQTDMDLRRSVNTAAEVPGEDEDSYTRS